MGNIRALGPQYAVRYSSYQTNWGTFIGYFMTIMGRERHARSLSLFHRAFFNSIMDKTPTHALFTQHYISLACWFY